MSWFSDRVLDGLGLEQPPVDTVQGADRDKARAKERLAPQRTLRTRRTTQVNHDTKTKQETTQIILFPSSGEQLLLTSISPLNVFILPHLFKGFCS